MYSLYMKEFHPIPLYFCNERMLGNFIRSTEVKLEWDSAELYAKSPCWIAYNRNQNFIGYLIKES